MQLRGTDLRYVLTRLLELSGPSTIQELIGGLAEWDFTVEGRPSKTVSDALRWEMGYGRVWRIGRGVYRAGEMPRGTDYRIRKRVAALREEVLSLRGGHFDYVSEPLNGQNRHATNNGTIAHGRFAGR